MQTSALTAYHVGDSDKRPWGGYVVTAVSSDPASGEDIVEKIITVHPKQMLSLQSHVGRSEVWTARTGTLTAVVNDRVVSVAQGGQIDLPIGTIHAMVNIGDTPIEVHEIQRGICREDDIVRYWDQSGRAVDTSDDPLVQASIATYKKLMETL